MAAPLVAAAAGMAAKYLAKRQGKQKIKKADKEDVKEDVKEISGEMRFREPRQRTDNEYITDYGRTPRMSDDMKKGGSVSSASKRADGCAQRGKTRA